MGRVYLCDSLNAGILSHRVLWGKLTILELHLSQPLGWPLCITQRFCPKYTVTSNKSFDCTVPQFPVAQMGFIAVYDQLDY